MLFVFAALVRFAAALEISSKALELVKVTAEYFDQKTARLFDNPDFSTKASKSSELAVFNYAFGKSTQILDAYSLLSKEQQLSKWEMLIEGFSCFDIDDSISGSDDDLLIAAFYGCTVFSTLSLQYLSLESHKLISFGLEQPSQAYKTRVSALRKFLVPALLFTLEGKSIDLFHPARLTSRSTKNSFRITYRNFVKEGVAVEFLVAFVFYAIHSGQEQIIDYRKFGYIEEAYDSLKSIFLKIFPKWTLNFIPANDNGQHLWINAAPMKFMETDKISMYMIPNLSKSISVSTISCLYSPVIWLAVHNQMFTAPHASTPIGMVLSIPPQTLSDQDALKSTASAINAMKLSLTVNIPESMPRTFKSALTVLTQLDQGQYGPLQRLWSLPLRNTRHNWNYREVLGNFF